MAHHVLLPRKNFFYAIGNTAPVCFTQDLVPEQGADILLLGCGDPRSILYTIYADLGAPNRRLDFTCCDVEPAVLARNVLLFTLLADGDISIQIDKIWNIFFHFYLDAPSLSLLRSQCRKLADLAIDINTWRNSPYSTFLKFCGKHTLSELRRHWILYEATESLPPNETKRVRELFAKGSRSALAHRDEKPSIVRAGRSAGPLWENAQTLGAEHFEHYWKTGITSNDKRKIVAATFLNPTFAYSMSGRGFSLHYATDPILAFHLAETFAPTKAASSNKAISIGDLAESVKSQFHTWCLAFQSRVTVASVSVTRNIVIRMFTGDALAFCQALHHCAQNHSIVSGIYSSTWGSSQINLDGGGYDKPSPESHCAPLSYDIIDTSNVTDHVGLLNILIASLPLLRKTPSAVLHTNYLLAMQGTSSNKLEDRACADIATLALLLGVVPTSFVSDFITQSNSHEIISFALSSSTFHEVVSWKRLPLTADYDPAQPLAYDPRQLGTFLFGIYLRMFSDDKLPNLNVLNPYALAQSIPHYVRATFVAMLQLIRQRVSTNWVQAMDHLVALIGMDRTLFVGHNYYQDLMCQLHIRGIHSVDVLTSNPHKAGQGEDFFRRWNVVPPVVCIVLRVPRTALKVIEEMDPDEIGRPILQCEVKSRPSPSCLGFQNVFSSIQLFFGNVTSSGVGTLVTEEDLRQWNGTSPLIASFHVPSWILNLGPSDIQVVLSIRGAVYSLLPKLGLEMCVFSASLTDSQHVFVVRERPNNELELKNLFNTAPQHLSSGSNLDGGVVSVRMGGGGHKASEFTARTNITEPGKRAALANKADVTVKQVSPYGMLASFGQFDQRISFPFPIDSSNSKVRIARKSFYIEVDVAIATTRSPFGLSLDPYPAPMDNSRPNLWNVHYLTLSRQPSLNVSSPGRLEFLHTHLGLAFSDGERTAKLSKANDIIVDVKESIMVILLHFAGLKTPQTRVFGLTDPNGGGIYTLIFANDLRLDLSAHTVVADACVLPLTHAVLDMTTVKGVLKKFSSVLNVRTAAREVKAWKQLLPVLAERCREWKHTENCEYIVTGIPVSTEFDQSPLCSCGKGKAVPPAFMKSRWKALSPLVTRIALGPLFSVSHLEEIGFMKEKARAITSRASPSVCAKCGGNGKPDLMKCSRCREVKYCSKACQNEDWKAHKTRCRLKEQK